MAKQDIGAAVHLIRGQINHLEQITLDLLAQHSAEQDEVEQVKIADEYEACWELRAQYVELLRRAQR